MGCNFDLSDIDFHGYATKNDVVCADGRIIRHDDTVIYKITM